MVKDIKKRGRKPKSVNIAEIMSLKDDGYTINEISELLGVNRSTILRRLRDYENEPSELEILAGAKKSSIPARFSIPKKWDTHFLRKNIEHLTVRESDTLWRLLTSSKTRGHEFVFEFIKAKLTREMDKSYPKDLIQRYWIDLESSMAILDYLFFDKNTNKPFNDLFHEFLLHKPLFEDNLHGSLSGKDKFIKAMSSARAEYSVSPDRERFIKSVKDFQKEYKSIKPRIIKGIEDFQYEINLKSEINDELNEGLEELIEFFKNNLFQHYSLLEKLYKSGWTNQGELPKVDYEKYQLWSTILKILRNTKPKGGK